MDWPLLFECLMNALWKCVLLLSSPKCALITAKLSTHQIYKVIKKKENHFLGKVMCFAKGDSRIFAHKYKHRFHCQGEKN